MRKKFYNRYENAINGNDIYENYWKERMRVREEMNQEQEREMLIREIVDEVLSRISVSVDVKDAILRIKELKKAMDSLKGGK